MPFVPDNYVYPLDSKEILTLAIQYLETQVGPGLTAEQYIEKLHSVYCFMRNHHTRLLIAYNESLQK